jgi:hypothetical protein
LDLRGRKQEKDGENSIMRGFIICTSPNISRMIELRRIKLAEPVVWTGEM